MYPKGCSLAFEVLMKETPYNHYDSGCDGICPECRSCCFHRPHWKYQSCVFEFCPYKQYQVRATVKSYRKMRDDALNGDPIAKERYEKTLAKRREAYHTKKSEQTA